MGNTDGLPTYRETLLTAADDLVLEEIHSFGAAGMGVQGDPPKTANDTRRNDNRADSTRGGANLEDAARGEGKLRYGPEGDRAMVPRAPVRSNVIYDLRG